MKFNNQKATNKITQYARTKEKISVYSGKLRWNQKCHLNSIHEAWRKHQNRVALVIQIEDDWCCIHFLNYDGVKFIDNTLGEWSRCYEYRFIKWIEEDEFHNISGIFSEYRKYLQTKLSWWERVTSNLEF